MMAEPALNRSPRALGEYRLRRIDYGLRRFVSRRSAGRPARMRHLLVVYDPATGDDVRGIPPGVAFTGTAGRLVLPGLRCPRHKFMLIKE